MPRPHALPEASAVDRLISGHVSSNGSSSVTPEDELQALALQIKHNLEHQHDWKQVHMHTHSPLPGGEQLSRPILSGLPPRRVYIHPDEQIELIKAGIRDEDVSAQAEWVLPSHLREKWSLSRFGSIFDAIPNVPPAQGLATDQDTKWRHRKRLLLATVEDDSTVVYYIVHDGIVKPRQN